MSAQQSALSSLYAGLMAKGGARPRSGPRADPQALRRQRDGKDWVRIPPEGRKSDPPPWPEHVYEPDETELAFWENLWRKPQAVIWEADQVYELVAFYVRTYLEAMHPKAGAQARMFVRSVGDDLYLSPDALFKARYVIAGSAEDEAIAASQRNHPAGRARTGSARQRFTIVDGGDDGVDSIPLPPVNLDEDEEADDVAGAAPAVVDEDDGEPPF